MIRVADDDCEGPCKSRVAETQKLQKLGFRKFFRNAAISFFFFLFFFNNNLGICKACC